jgi:acyl-CoA synthetase (AMP-forming)/AMP-acid ligase II
LIDSDVKVLFGMASMSNVLVEAVRMTKMKIQIVYTTQNDGELIPFDGIRFNELTELKGLDLSLIKEGDRDCDSVTLLPYSSGTTGLSKGVMLSHLNIVSNCVMIKTPPMDVSKPAIDNYQDVLPCVLPFFQIYGLTVTLLSKLALGSKIVTLPRFTPDSFINALVKHRGNILHLVPPIVIFFSNFNLKREQTESITHTLCGAAPLGPSDIEKYLNIAPNSKFIQAYGLTETSPVTHTCINTTLGSVGPPLFDTEAKIVKIDDETFTALPPNEQGELLVRGPQIMKGYLNNEKATQDTITPDGWLRTGDIGYYDENRDFYITDRLKELIKVKGFQVAPAELEEILRTHPEISDAAVIGVPDQKCGELPRAFVVVKNKNVNEKEIKEFVASKVAEYKKLEGGVEFIEQIPKNATGKILRRELKKKYL